MAKPHSELCTSPSPLNPVEFLHSSYPEAQDNKKLGATAPFCFVKQNSCDHLGLNKDELQLERAPAPAPRSKPPDCSAWAGAEGSEDAQRVKCSSECPLCMAKLDRTVLYFLQKSVPFYQAPKNPLKEGQSTNRVFPSSGVL